MTGPRLLPDEAGINREPSIASDKPLDTALDAARAILAEVDAARCAPAEDKHAWSDTMLAQRHGELASTLRRLVDAVETVERDRLTAVSIIRDAVGQLGGEQ